MGLSGVNTLGELNPSYVRAGAAGPAAARAQRIPVHRRSRRPLLMSDMLESQRVRKEIREGRTTGTSRGLAHGFVQCNLAILPKQYAFDFLLYCQRNQRSCPVLEVTDPGTPEPKKLAPGADLRTDCARYAIYRDGVRLEDRTDIRELWRDDLVAFLIGSGITIDGPLERAGVPTHKDRWVLRTSLPTEPAGPFRGDLIVTMRWLTGAAGADRYAGDVALSLQPRRADPSSAIRRRSVPTSRRRCSARRCRRRRRISCRCSGPAASPRRARRRTPSCRCSSRTRRRIASSPICRPKP